jgi:hypothetical protein
VLYKNFGPITSKHGDMRIFAPAAYPLVREIQIVPIVYIEALALASWFPICWRAGEPRPTLVALRTLRKDGSQQPAGSPEAAASLPLVLRAYPFVTPALGTNETQDVPMIEDATADKPTDIGAPILMSNGRTGRGTEMRLRTVAAYQGALPLTEDMTNMLSKNNLLESWPLDFKIGDESLAVEDMLIVRQSAFGTAPILDFIKTFGTAGANLLGAHRLSLFRAGSLVQAARKSSPVNAARDQGGHA